MSKVKMPEPSMYGLFNDDGQLFRVCGSDEEAINAALDAGGIVEIERYITTDQAEAYKDACVREALKLAADTCAGIAIPTSQYSPNKQAALECALAIRALIPQEGK